ncbi:Esterase [Psilocybe cubensis]|uniref:Serine hydrolase domain-containing protein n=2 Tax=Psilocybe cubensis TaxID=181762 RepID=A0A8H7Y8Y8_PSICU|nr:Esterase [Psilocybe cubensis]KAH9485664.1 Esterase [Psilocybe cubensis]
MAGSVLKRVLVLHGYSQNAVVFSKRLGALRKERKDLEFVFVNAPHILQAAEMFASEQASMADTQSDPNTALRGWWKANKEKTKVEGLEESLSLIRDVLKEQRFDLERPHLYPAFLEDGKPLHPPFQFCVAVSGFRLKDPFCDPVFEQKYTTPTLHVLGRTDVVVVEERSRSLVDVSANARVEEHDGGHFVPSKGNWRKFLVNWMMDPSAPHFAPSTTSAMSQPGSGAATPVGTGADNKEALLMKL